MRNLANGVQMQEIVIATDFSSRSDRALRRAALLADEFGAKLTLLHVVDDDQAQSLVEVETTEAHRLLQDQIQTLPHLRGLRCRAEVAAGVAFDGIIKAADRAQANLIVMGSHRKQLLRDIFVGTTVERVIRTGVHPVLVVNQDLKRPYRNAIAAVDMSDSAAHAVSVAKSLGLLDEPKLTLLHAFIAPAKLQLLAADAPRDQIEEYVAGQQRVASEELVAFLDSHQLHGSEWDHRIEEGDAFEVIAQAVEELQPDLLVMGSHGRSGIPKLLLGSVAETVLRRLDVDILAVPPR